MLLSCKNVSVKFQASLRGSLRGAAASTSTSVSEPSSTQPLQRPSSSYPNKPLPRLQLIRSMPLAHRLYDGRPRQTRAARFAVTKESPSFTSRCACPSHSVTTKAPRKDRSLHPAGTLDPRTTCLNPCVFPPQKKKYLEDPGIQKILHLYEGRNDQQMIWTQPMVNWWFGLVVWDSNRGTPKNRNPFDFWGIQSESKPPVTGPKPPTNP